MGHTSWHQLNHKAPRWRVRMWRMLYTLDSALHIFMLQGNQRRKARKRWKDTIGYFDGQERTIKVRVVLDLDRDSTGEEGWFGHFENFPGCMSQGNSIEEALRRLADAYQDWSEALPWEEENARN